MHSIILHIVMRNFRILEAINLNPSILTEPIAAFLKYVTKLKYDEKPDYEKCRKYFSDGLKALGKTNSGELEFKLSSSTSVAAKKTKAVSPLKEQRPKVSRPSAKTAAATSSAPKVTHNTENISPKPRPTRKLDTASDDSASPSKKARTSKSSTQARPSKASTQIRSGKTTTTNSSIVVKNTPREEEGKKHKTFNINVDLDISFDANVVVSVKRKKNKQRKNDADEIGSPNQSIQSTDEIPPSDKSFVVQTTKIYKRAPRSSPRTK